MASTASTSHRCLDGGTQPIYNEDKSKVIVFNGEIYNYKEIKKELVKKGYKFKTK
ncbi:MAG: hypothetical protein II801_00395, partial [Bacteroidaceae bacterium]|nr:hypothetical protein [Bacteroidaceae bacterium]